MKKKPQPPVMLEGMNDPLRVVLEEMGIEDLLSMEGQQLVNDLTRALDSTLVVMGALLMIPSEEMGFLLKEKDETLRKLLMLLSSAFFNLRVAFEEGSQKAEQMSKKVNQKLESVATTMPIELLNILLASAEKEGLVIHDSIIAVARDRFGEDYTGMSDDDGALFADGLPMPDKIVNQMREAFPDDMPYYELYNAMLEFFGNRLPEDATKTLIITLLSGKDEKAQAAGLLFILHADKTLRAQATEVLIDVYDYLELSEANLSRLYQLVYWLPEAEREDLSQSLGLTLNLPPTKPNRARELLRVQGNFCDGSGCFTSTILAKTGETIQVINVLCKEQYGVKDCILTSDFDDLDEAEEMFDGIIASLEDHGLLTSRVPLSVLLPQWEHFIEVGHQQSTLPPATLVAVAEIVSETYWMPTKLESAAVARKFLAMHLPKDKASARERSKDWLSPTHHMGLWSWFETNAALHKLVARSKRQTLSKTRLYDQILADILLPDRQRWLERLLLCGLILEAMDEDEQGGEVLPDFAVLIDAALLDSTFVAHPFMRQVAELSARSSQERARVEGGVLDVVS